MPLRQEQQQTVLRWRAPGQIDSRIVVANIPAACPARLIRLLLVSAEDGYVTEEVADVVHALWACEKPFRHVTIQGAPHNIRRVKFVEFMDAVTGFLEEIST